MDVAAGGRDKTVWTVADEEGVIDQIVMDTPNTMEIPGRTIELMSQYKVPASQVAFDAGGGGKQIADRLQEQGHWVQIVGFGEGPDTKQAYKNRRTEMYGTFREFLNPDREEGIFALPPDCHQLQQELGALPLQYDSEGRMLLPPKDHSAAGPHQGPSLRQLLGRSPDRADSLVLAVWALHKSSRDRNFAEAPLAIWGPCDMTPEEIADLPPELLEMYEGYDEMNREDEAEREEREDRWDIDLY